MNRVTLLILAVGFASAVTVFLQSKPPVMDPLLGDYRSSKRYQHELKLMGGKANVLVDEFQEWLANQWHGRELARTIIVFSVGTTLLFRLIASHPDNVDRNLNESSEERKS